MVIENASTHGGIFFNLYMQISNRIIGLLF